MLDAHDAPPHGGPQTAGSDRRARGDEAFHPGEGERVHRGRTPARRRQIFARRSRLAFPTTVIELRAIAVSAIAGWRRPRKATGMATTL